MTGSERLHALRLAGAHRPMPSRWHDAFARIGAPFTVLRHVPTQRPREVYGYDLLLLRPDLHVVWRGNTLPEPEPLAGVRADTEIDWPD